MAARQPGALVFQLSPEVVQWMDGGATIWDLAEVKKKKGRDAGFVPML